MSIHKQAQSILEYVTLVAVVAAAFVAMFTYVNRAVNAKLHQVEKEVSPDIVIEVIHPEPE